MARSKEEKQHLLNKIRELGKSGSGWWHVIDFGDGIRTPVEYNPLEKENPLYHLAGLDELGLIPKDMTGLRVLDIGAYSGGYSVEFARRGANVTSIEHHPPGFAQLSFVNEELGLGMDCRLYEALNISEEDLGRFDIVFCLGIIYHCIHPMLLLQKISGVCDDMLVLESEAHHKEGRSHWVQFVEKDYGLHDETNWWIPGVEAMRGMMRTVDFDMTRVIDHPLASRAMVVGRKRSRLDRGKLSILHESRQLKILWEGKEITADSHLCTAYKSRTGFTEFEKMPEAWAHSTDRRLFINAITPEPHKLVIEKDYYFWDMIERWEIKLINDHELALQISLDCEHPLDISEMCMTFPLTDVYDKCVTTARETSSFFEKIPGGAEILKLVQKVKSRSVPAICFTTPEKNLPRLTIECVSGMLSDIPGAIRDGGTEHYGPAVHFRKAFQGLAKGKHIIFTGRLSVHE